MTPQQEAGYFCTKCKLLLLPGRTCPKHGIKYLTEYDVQSVSDESDAKVSSSKSKKRDKKSKSSGKSRKGRKGRKDLESSSSSSEESSSESEDPSSEDDRRKKKKKTSKSRKKSKDDSRKSRKKDKKQDITSDSSSESDDPKSSKSREDNTPSKQPKSDSKKPTEVPPLETVKSEPGQSSYVEAVKQTAPLSNASTADFPSLKDGVSVGPRLELKFDRCSLSKKSAWPRDFEKYDFKQEGKARQKWFPGTLCAKCGQQHPTDACGRFWEAFTRKLDRDRSDPDNSSKCQICRKSNHQEASWSHFTSDHGLMALYDLPSNPPISTLGNDRLLQFDRPWPNARGLIPFHPYAFHPKRLKDEKPESYPNLHDPFQPLKHGLMVDDGNAKGQISALQNNLQYSSRWKKPKPNKSDDIPKPDQGKGSKQTQGKANPIKKEPDADSKPDKQLNPSSLFKSLDNGYEGYEHHPKLPNPHWKQDGSMFPSKPFLDAIYVIVSKEVREYCQHLRTCSEQYRVVMGKFPDLKETKAMSEVRKKCNQSAWDILSRYITYWRPKQYLSEGIQEQLARRFGKQEKFDPLEVRKIVKSLALDKVEAALKEAETKASRPEPEIKLVVPGGSKDNKSKKQNEQKSGTRAIAVEVELERVFALSKKVSFQISLNQSDGSKVKDWAEGTTSVEELDDKEYCHPQVDPRLKHHYAAHIAGWKAHIETEISEARMDKFLWQFDSDFRYFVFPTFERANAGPSIIKAIMQLQEDFKESIHLLAENLCNLVGPRFPGEDEPEAEFKFIVERIGECFDDYDKYISTGIETLKKVEGFCELVKSHPDLQSQVLDVLMGIHLPGKLPLYTSIPRFAWSEDSVGIIERQEAEELEEAQRLA